MNETIPSHSLLQALQADLEHCLASDRSDFERQLQRLRQRLERGQPADKIESRLRDAMARSCAARTTRMEQLPEIRYNDDLPIAQKRQVILDALRDHQVVIVAGETGSGKTTQLPKICLELGRGIDGLIGHTQPRRIAARTVASRIAEELGTTLGDKVGYQVRFHDQSGDNTYIKLMTDGILLAEIQQDRLLSRYDTLIIDEAHERSLNIDFLLGYLKRILPERPDLKVVITSATIDVERFSRHFDNAPIIEVSGRTYPVDVLYRPPLDQDEDIYGAILNAVDEIFAMPKRGDILVFLSGEREIRETAYQLRRVQQQGQLRDIEILPLYARLSLKDQTRIFQPHRGTRIVLATNVAETSITVPGIRYVIDTGYARISRYSYRTKVQRLPIEPVSQASANQRAGRCGRVSDGVCLRLYSEEDFLSRPEFTDAEILRTNLAAVILKMLHMRIGDVRDFPFVDPPDHRLINDGFQLLSELGAVSGKGELSAIGRQLSQLPVDPRLGRMLVAASGEGALAEVLVIASALSIQDPRERPADKRQAADEKHRAWLDPESDFISLLNLWNHFEEQRQDLTRNQFSQYCHRHFVSYLRMREWRDLEHQLRLACKNAGLVLNRNPAGNDTIHRALLVGLLSHIGMREENKEYLGARNRKFMLFPGSGVFKKSPKWIMAAELIETSRLFAHTVATINPDWLPPLAGHLVRKSWSEPHYDSRRGQVMAFERQTLFGLTILDRKRVGYAAIDPAISREVFIRGALVEGKYRGKGHFFKANRDLVQELEELEDRLRQRDIVIDDETIYRFYDQRIPADRCSLAGFEKWRKQAEAANPQLLYLDRETLIRNLNLGDSISQFPAEIDWQGTLYRLSYRFEPGHESDGVTLHVPLPILHQVPTHRFEWLVPGLLRDKCIALVKNLPKKTRKLFVPVPDYVDKALSAMSPENRPLGEVLGEQLKRHTGITIPPADWDEGRIDEFFRINYRLEDENGKVIALSRDLSDLKSRYKSTVQSVIEDASGSMKEQRGLDRWSFGELAQKAQLQRGNLSIEAFPALVDENDSVAVRLLDNAAEADWLTDQGVLRLMLLVHPEPAKYLRKQLLKKQALKLLAAGLGEVEPLVEDMIRASYRIACLDGKDQPRSEQQFNDLLQKGRSGIVAQAQTLEQMLISLLEPLAETRRWLVRWRSQYPFAVKDVEDQLNNLFRSGFMAATGAFWLQQYPRYIQAAAQRLEKLPAQPIKDRSVCDEVAAFGLELTQLTEEMPVISRAACEDIEKCRFMLEEYRVSVFAQVLKTAMPVSPKRIRKQLDQVRQTHC